MLGDCPGLRLINFGDRDAPLKEGREVWTVKLVRDPAVRNSTEIIPLFGDATGDEGHIDHVSSVSFSLSSPPLPKLFTRPRIPAMDFTLISRFDFSMKTDENNAFRHYLDAWIRALRDHAYFPYIYKRADFGALPVSLDDIVLYTSDKPIAAYRIGSRL